MKKIIVTAVGALAMACGGAAAQELAPTGTVTYDTGSFDALPWYVSGKVGVALPGTITVTSVPGPFVDDFSGHASFDPGFAGAVSIGKYLTQQVRTELELATATNTGRSFEGSYSGIVPPLFVPGDVPMSGPLTGNVTTTSIMVMGYYDFTQFGDFAPYLGAGLGVARVKSDLTFTDTSGYPTGTTTGSSTVIAARIGAGFEYKIADSLSITADYTAMFGGEANFTYSDGWTSHEVTSNVMGHALAVGIKGSF